MDYFGSICLSDIPKELIRTGKNGKKYLSIDVRERREPSQYGDTHFIKAYCKKSEQKEGVNYFIGELKQSVYSEQKPFEVAANNPTPERGIMQELPKLYADAKAKAIEPKDDDLPF